MDGAAANVNHATPPRQGRAGVTVAASSRLEGLTWCGATAASAHMGRWQRGPIVPPEVVVVPAVDATALLRAARRDTP